MIRSMLTAAALLLCSLEGAAACEGFKSIDPVNSQKMIDLIQSADAKAVDQIFAFRTLSCSDEPVIRRLATDEALRSKSQILRSMGLAEIMLQREGLTIELHATGADNNAKNWVQQNGSMIKLLFSKPNYSLNCIGVGGNDCSQPQSSQVRVDGDKIRVLWGSMKGELQVSEDRVLRGWVSYLNSAKIEAKADLQ